MSKFRQIRVEQGDTLRGIALREHGDPTRWIELASDNDLRMPYITASHLEADRISGTALWGDAILLRWVGNATLKGNNDGNFGADVALPHGELTTSGGDMALLAGVENIAQALSHRLKTVRGELTYHPQYGCFANLAVGLPTVPFASLMAAAWVHEALKEEPRIANVLAVDADVRGDAVRVGARVALVDRNSPIDLNLVLNP